MAPPINPGPVSKSNWFLQQQLKRSFREQLGLLGKISLDPMYFEIIGRNSGFISCLKVLLRLVLY